MRLFFFYLQIVACVCFFCPFLILFVGSLSACILGFSVVGDSFPALALAGIRVRCLPMCVFFSFGGRHVFFLVLGFVGIMFRCLPVFGFGGRCVLYFLLWLLLVQGLWLF